MTLPSPIPDALVEMIAERFRLLAEPMRVRALDHLRSDGPSSVSEVAERLGSSQQNISKHLNALYAGGVLERQRDGNRVIYSLSDETVIAICEAVCGSIERRADELSRAVAEVRS
jgi:DNA-binding transcriptional ArsR family regulator